MADLQQLLRNVSLEESTAHLVRDAKDAQREFMALAIALEQQLPGRDHPLHEPTAAVLKKNIDFLTKLDKLADKLEKTGLELAKKKTERSWMEGQNVAFRGQNEQLRRDLSALQEIFMNITVPPSSTDTAVSSRADPHANDE